MRSILLISLLMLFSLPLFGEDVGVNVRDLCKDAVKGEPSKRETAVRQLRYFLTDKEVVRTYATVLKDEKLPAVLIAAIESLRTQDAIMLFDSVYPHIRHYYLDVRRNASFTLAAQNRELLIKNLLSDAKKNDESSIEAIRALGRVLNESEGALLTNFLKSKNGDVRAVTVAALMRIGVFQEAPKIAALLADPHRPAREQAMLGCAFFRVKDSVPKLLTLLKEPDYKDYALAALMELTGRQFGDDVKIWSDWWQNVGSTIDMPPFERLKGEGVVKFFDHTVRAVRFVLLLDYSDSMGSGTGSSLEAQVNEAKRCVIPLYPNVEFNCVSYSRSADRFVSCAVESDSLTKRDFSQWLRTQGTGAYTATYDGFKLALDVPELNLIFLSGNGVPNWGDLPTGKNPENEDNVIEAVRDNIKQRNLNTVIYTVAFPFGKDIFEDKPDIISRRDQATIERTFDKRCESFFRLMAALNGGKYCFVPISQKKTKP